MTLNKIFASHMVFAAHRPIRIYGEGTGTVTVEFAGIKKTLTSKQPRWMVEFPAMEYGGPFCLNVTFEDETICLEDIYIGLVYLFAGQSNMQFKLRESNTPTDSYRSNTMLRLFTTKRLEENEYFSPEDGWVVCKKEQVENWSALAYLAGNEVSASKQVAVGAIACYQGASVIESWVPKGTFEAMDIHIPIEQKTNSHTRADYAAWNGDGTLYSFALSQVIPFSISAVIWYQGESDSSPSEGLVYCDELAAMIDIWRKDFQNDSLPFIIIQIADNINVDALGWRRIQQAQLDVQTKRPWVTTVTCADVCENDDIHPKTKDKLAHRIAAALLKKE